MSPDDFAGYEDWCAAGCPGLFHFSPFYNHTVIFSRNFLHKYYCGPISAKGLLRHELSRIADSADVALANTMHQFLVFSALLDYFANELSFLVSFVFPLRFPFSTDALKSF